MFYRFKGHGPAGEDSSLGYGRRRGSVGPGAFFSFAFLGSLPAFFDKIYAIPLFDRPSEF